MSQRRSLAEQQLVVASLLARVLVAMTLALATLWHGIFYEIVQISISNAITEASKWRAGAGRHAKRVCVRVCLYVCVCLCMCLCYCYSYAALHERMSARRGGATVYVLCKDEAFP